MMTRFAFTSALLLWSAFCFVSPLIAQTDVPRIITYQGQLTDNIGKPIYDGKHTILVCLYSDEKGQDKLWTSSQTIESHNGIFSVELGNQVNQLPEFNGATYVGIAVNGSPEMRPLTLLTASPYALAIPNASVTKDKIASNFLAGINIDGKYTTRKGSILNLKAGTGISFEYNEINNSLTLNSIGSILAEPQWIGNNSACTTGGGNLNDDAGIATNSIGGGCGNTIRISGGGTQPTYASIFGGFDNRATNDFAFVGGGDTNWAKGGHSSIAGGFSNLAEGTFSSIIGGATNKAQGNFSVVGGGDQNQATASHSTVGGGAINTATGQKTVVAGGQDNHATAQGASVLGGEGNQSRNDDASISGGNANIADGGASFIGAGVLNEVDGTQGFIGAGGSNSAAGDFSAVVGGGPNTATGKGSFIGGGLNEDAANHTATGVNSIIGGGFINTVSSNLSSILGGANNTINSSATHALIGGGQNNTVASSATHAVIAGGQENNASAVHSTVVGGHKNVASGIGSFVGGGANSTTNNTAAGANSVVVGGLTNTATPDKSAIVGGEGNGIAASADLSFVGGGSSNDILTSMSYGAISGGKDNEIRSVKGLIGGGEGNIVGYKSTHTTISGGFENKINSGVASNSLLTTDYSTISGGYQNQINVFGGGPTNSSNYCFIGGGKFNNVWAGYSTIGGGRANGIGVDNLLTEDISQYSFVGGGFGNVIYYGHYANSITGGEGNITGANTKYSSIGGGYTNQANQSYCTIPGGRELIAQSYGQSVLGYFNKLQGTSTESSINANDRVFILGNGTSNGSRSNAFEVSNNGHSIVYHDNTSGIASIHGATYKDNIIYAWAVVDVTPNLPAVATVTYTSNFGVATITPVAIGVYNVVLTTNDVDGSPAPISSGAVTATLLTDTDPTSEGKPPCETQIYSSRVTSGTFTIKIVQNQSTCEYIDLPFMFHVTGRP